MQNSKAIGLTALAMLAGALVANRTLRAMTLPQPRLLRLDAFPRQIGPWRAGPDRAVDPIVYDTLPTAHILDRVYTDDAGHSVDLTLVTASRYADMHDPAICFPAQGWVLADVHRDSVAGGAVTEMIATRGDEQLDVLYGWAVAAPAPVQSTLMQRAGALRTLLGAAHGQSLLVRLTVPRADAADHNLRAAARTMMAAADALASSQRG